MTHHTRKARKRRTLSQKERNIIADALDSQAERCEFRHLADAQRGLAFVMRRSIVVVETEAAADHSESATIEERRGLPLRGSDSKSDPRD